jgi:chromosome partitioning protein
MLLFTLVALSMEPAPAGKAKTAHVIVLGNEKGGAGKSTMAINVIIALLKAGHSVASVDTDSRQRSLTRMIENRAAWARRSGLWLEVPTHYVVKLGRGEVVREIEAHEFDGLADVIDQVEREFDFVVIDTPASDSFLMRISHSMADTLITPINDSFMDLDVLGHLDPGDYSVIGISHYAELVREARRQRLLVDGVATDWIVVRNRLATLASRNQRHVLDALSELSTLLDFRLAGGVSERVIFRELFATGLTALDGLDRQTLGGEPTMSHVAGRQEVRDLVDGLRLPGTRRSVLRAADAGLLSGVRMLAAMRAE